MSPLWEAHKVLLSGIHILENYAFCRCCLLYDTMLLAANDARCMPHGQNLFFYETTKISTNIMNLHNLWIKLGP
jgi:hypothetical protein